MSNSHGPHIELSVEDGIAHVQLTRPEKRNALSFQMIDALTGLGEALGKDRSLRGVLLSGAGESFCAGIDLHDLRDPKQAVRGAWELTRPGANRFQQVFLVWRALPVPVVAAIQGHCLGAGMQLALGADFRIAKPDAQLSIMEAKWGLVPDMGISVTLRGLVGLDVAKELMMTARIVQGSDAKALGLISHVSDDPLAHARALLAEIAVRSPDAVAAAKRLCNAMLVEDGGTTLALEKRLQRRLMLGKNFKIAAKRAKEPGLPWQDRKIS